MIEWLLDGTLAALLLILAIAVIRASGLYASVVLFIAFGLLLALTWARLGAPDLALAEAAIGAGLTGVLLLGALAHARPERPSNTLYGYRWPAALVSMALAALLIRAVWPLAETTQPLPAQVMTELEASGVSHPVTAVLLNFRAWDTLLELLVVLFAFLGLRQLRLAPLAHTEPWPLLAAWGRLLAPLALVIGGYLLWRGTSAPGGAFQGGALLAAGLVVLRLNGVLPALSWRQWPVRLGVLLGVTVFLAVAALTHAFGAGWLTYPVAWNTPLIVAIEVAATLSIALTLALLVVGEPEEVHP
ncbi:hydrogenase subunit MbhD domain-containing protein [Marinimicrobium alkaliphilum]|uniref:hydrogenase subunit MbhD domain-containing protein n=1 Tax=Marinimicrobium alkaliphilum TaxID=2202654 RepID=UPI000DB9E781|nr:hydrogenase subunit MbhD domain-containing protein [Marinimicrobium alkaliphilum]